MATGETIGAEELGGAKVHATITGLADQMASDEYDFPPGVRCNTDLVVAGLMLSERRANGWPHYICERLDASTCSNLYHLDIRRKTYCPL